jgi:pimeloyl-ACP methyl ester carboxylesterase
MLVGANGIRINVVQEGSGEPVIFLHAGACDWQMWRPQADVFSSRYRCVMWDARGHGRSDTTFGPYSYAMYSHDLFDVLTAL